MGMKRTMSILWSFLLALVLSALILSTDSDIGSIRAVFSMLHISSVLFIALLIAFPIGLCVYSFYLRGWKGFLVSLILGSAILGTVVAFYGSTAQTSAGILASALGMAGIGIAVYGLGSLPHIFLMQRQNESAGTVH